MIKDITADRFAEACGLAACFEADARRAAIGASVEELTNLAEMFVHLVHLTALTSELLLLLDMPTEDLSGAEELDLLKTKESAKRLLAEGLALIRTDETEAGPNTEENDNG